MKLGEEVLRAQPFAYVVNVDKAVNVCDFCLKECQPDVRLNRCSGCKLVRYCNRSCQTPAWKQHRDECKYLKNVAPKIPGDTVRLLARIILKLRNGGTKETASLPNGTKRRFEDLKSHRKEIVRDTERMEAFRSFFAVLQDCFKDSVIPQAEEVLEIYGRVLINSFNIMNNDFQAIGIGLYLGASVFDHSCQPNASVVFDGKEIIVRAIEDNADVEFDQVRICYTNLLNTSADRRKDLKDQYYFDCNCLSCEEDPKTLDKIKERSMKCPSCDGAIPLEESTSSSVSCHHCLNEVNAATVLRYQSLRQELQTKFFQNKGNHPEPELLSEEFYPDLKPLFHQYDKRYIDFLEALYDVKTEQQDWTMVLEVGGLLLTAYKRLYPKYDVNTAMMLLKVGKVYQFVGKLLDAEECLEQARETLLVTHGKDHSLVRTALKDLITDIKLELRVGGQEKNDDIKKMQQPIAQVQQAG